MKIVILTNEKNEKYWQNIKLLPHLFSDDKEIRFFATNFDDAKEISLYLQRIMTARKNQTVKASNKEELYKNFSTYY